MMTAEGQAMPAGARGVIHDLGYRRYEGVRLGRPAIIRALCWHSLRSAFGIGRGAKAKIIPFTLFGVMCLPAVVNAVVVARGTGTAPVFPYDTYVFRLRAFVMTVFLAAQAPELVSRDLRNRVLPLYLSRPLRRLDYPLAKYLAFTAACLIVIDVPVLLLYLGTIFSVHGPAAVWHQTREMVPGLLMGALWAVVLAAIGLLLASLTGRRAYATGTVAIYFFLTWTLATLLINIAGPGPATASAPLAARIPGLISPFTVLDGTRQWLGGALDQVPAPGGIGAAYGIMALALLAIGTGGLAARYRRAGAL